MTTKDFIGKVEEYRPVYLPYNEKEFKCYDKDNNDITGSSMAAISFILSPEDDSKEVVIISKENFLNLLKRIDSLENKVNLIDKRFS